VCRIDPVMENRHQGKRSIMAYLGIGYEGEDPDFFHARVRECDTWLTAERTVRFFGDRFIVLYDSNSAREFVHVCLAHARTRDITVFEMTTAPR
jgi:hypothetical protein